MSEAAGARHEIKCIVEAGRASVVERWLALHPAAFREAFPERLVHNIYFDGPRRGCYAENLAGTSARSKCRLRWYGEGRATREAVLEFKDRRNRLGSKRRHAVSFALPLWGLTYAQITATTAAALPEPGRTAFAGAAEAVLLNRYRRRYFVSFDGRVRLTLDRDLAFFAPWSRSKPDTRFPVNSAAIVILECKFASEDAAHARSVVSELPARVSRCSKYALGMQWLLGL